MDLLRNIDTNYLGYLVVGVIIAIIFLKLLFEKVFFIVIIGFMAYICYDIYQSTGFEGMIIFIVIALILTIPLTIWNPLGVGSDYEDDKKKNKKR